MEPPAATALLEDPELRPFLPLLWVAWADGDLEPDEMAVLEAHLEAMPWLRPAVRIALARWLDPAQPPTMAERRAVLTALRRTAGTMRGERRQDLFALAGALAQGTTDGAVTDEHVRPALDALARALGLSSAQAAARLTRDLADPQPTAVAASVTTPTLSPPAATAPLPTDVLGDVLDGPHGDVRRAVRAFLSDPSRRAYGLGVDEYRALVARWLGELASTGIGALAYPGVTSDTPDLSPFVVAFETLAFGDLSLLVRFGVQFGLFGGSIYFLGSDEQRRRLLPGIATLATPGCFAMSEVGHGSNVRELETVARWDAARGVFVLHTPSESARKDWVGGAARFARFATVFAQLEVAGEHHGVHAFFVPIRDEAGELLPGVRAGDSGHKLGLNGVDNGRLWFDHVELPREALLARFAEVSETGVYGSAIAQTNKRFFTMLSTLVGGRISVAAGAVSVAKVALAIAVRYAAVRRQFGPEGEAEVPLLTYATHKRRLLPRLATTYVLHFALERLRGHYAAASQEGATELQRRELEVAAAALKALATAHASETAFACREACGAQGYFSRNRLPSLLSDVNIFTTFEGDNTVLLQLVARSVLTSFKRRFAGGSVVSIARYLAVRASVVLTEKNPLVVRRTDPEHLRDRAFHLAALRYREERLTALAALTLRDALEAGEDSFAAMDRVQERLVEIGDAYGHRLALEWFDEAVAGAPEEVRPWLDRLGALHALSVLDRHATFFLEEGYFEAAKTRALRTETTRLLQELAEGAVPLVDAFRIPAVCLAAPIAFMDPAHPRWE